MEEDIANSNFKSTYRATGGNKFGKIEVIT
jgi:hypothetical protein